MQGIWIQWNGMVDCNGGMEWWNGNKLDTSDLHVQTTSKQNHL